MNKSLADLRGAIVRCRAALREEEIGDEVTSVVIQGDPGDWEGPAPLVAGVSGSDEDDVLALALYGVFGTYGLQDLESSMQEGVLYYDLSFTNGFSFSVSVTEDDEGTHLAVLTGTDGEEPPTVLLDPHLFDDGDIDPEKFPGEFILNQVEGSLPPEGTEPNEEEPESESVSEAFRVVIRGGKKKRIKVRRRVTAGGKKIRHRMSVKQKMALRKARLKSQKPGARKKRQKSDRMRKRLKLKTFSARTLRAL